MPLTPVDLGSPARPDEAQHPSTNIDNMKKLFIAKIIIRISLVAVCAFAAYKGVSLLLTGTFAFMASPALGCLALSGIVAYKGALAIISAVASGSLMSLATGLAMAPVSCAALAAGATLFLHGF